MSAWDARRPREAAPWRGTAFLVEACLLLAVIVGCVAVFASLFARAGAEGGPRAAVPGAVRTEQATC